jgi:hypothetical protein
MIEIIESAATIGLLPTNGVIPVPGDTLTLDGTSYTVSSRSLVGDKCNDTGMPMYKISGSITVVAV